tara:strand:- start:27 stop:605 length:579 start_codon:yes stop_codon:yes gene_type:complete
LEGNEQFELMETKLDFSNLSKEEIIRFWNLLGHKSEDDRFCLALVFDNEKCTCPTWTDHQEFDLEEDSPAHVDATGGGCYYLHDLATCMYCDNYYLGYHHGGIRRMEYIEFYDSHVWNDKPTYQDDDETKEEWLDRVRDKKATEELCYRDWRRGSGFCFPCENKFKDEIQKMKSTVNIDEELIQAEKDKQIT